MTDILHHLSNALPLSPLATHIGITCLFAQLTFTLLFHKRTKILPEGPWTHLPAFTAHQLVALPLMILLTYIGFRDWFFDPNKDPEGATSADRIFGSDRYPNDPNNIPLAVGTGAILLWDIPLGFLSKPLRDPIMWGHHVGMFMVAATMTGMFCAGGDMIGHYYASFYFGIIELSGVFLTYVDVFHPKYKYFKAWLDAEHSNKQMMSLKSALNSANELARVLFAVSFLILRGIYFPYVSFFHAIPDLIVAFKNPPEGVPMWTGYFLMGMISSFAILQAYWGLFVGQQVKKTLFGGEKDEKKSGKKKK